MIYIHAARETFADISFMDLWAGMSTSDESTIIWMHEFINVRQKKYVEVPISLEFFTGTTTTFGLFSYSFSV